MLTCGWGRVAGPARVPSELALSPGAWSRSRQVLKTSGRYTGKAHGVSALPAEVETLYHYIAEAADGRKASTLQRRLAAISQAHKLVGFGAESPAQDGCFREMWKGIRRTKGTAPTKKAPALTADLRAIVETLADTPASWGGCALLLIGFAAALRRNELVALDVEHVAFGRNGLTVTLPQSKTDQEGERAQLGVPYGSNPETCPVRSLQRWLEVGRSAPARCSGPSIVGAGSALRGSPIRRSPSS